MYFSTVRAGKNKLVSRKLQAARKKCSPQERVLCFCSFCYMYEPFRVNQQKQNLRSRLFGRAGCSIQNCRIWSAQNNCRWWIRSSPIKFNVQKQSTCWLLSWLINFYWRSLICGSMILRSFQTSGCIFLFVYPLLFISCSSSSNGPCWLRQCGCQFH